MASWCFSSKCRSAIVSLSLCVFAVTRLSLVVEDGQPAHFARRLELAVAALPVVLGAEGSVVGAAEAVVAFVAAVRDELRVFAGVDDDADVVPGAAAEDHQVARLDLALRDLPHVLEQRAGIDVQLLVPGAARIRRARPLVAKRGEAR